MRYSIQFFTDVQGHNPVLEFLEGLNEKQAAKCLYYIDLLAEHGNRLPANYIKHVEGDVWSCGRNLVALNFDCFISSCS